MPSILSHRLFIHCHLANSRMLVNSRNHLISILFKFEFKSFGFLGKVVEEYLSEHLVDFDFNAALLYLELPFIVIILIGLIPNFIL